MRKQASDLLIAFFGTPEFAVRVLEKMAAHAFLPALIITSPDARKGRGRVLAPPPAKTWGMERGIDVSQPAMIKDGALAAELRNSAWDLFIVAAYGKIIPKDILAIPRYGTLNVHPSLLPKFRGPSPVVGAILADARETGVTVMQLDEELDHGPIVAQARVELDMEDWPLAAGTLEALLADEGAELLCEAIPPWISGELVAQEQTHADATFTKKYVDADARIDLLNDPYQNFLKIRAFDANPRAYMLLEKNGKPMRVSITDAELRDGTLSITRVIPEGKKEMGYEDFMRGFRS